MFIEYQGRFDDDRKRFICLSCGSVFVAEAGEYLTKQDYAYLPAAHICNCPICGRECHANN